MTHRDTRSEKWLLWTYGALNAVLLLIFQLVDVLVTDAPEAWYQNVSYIAGATIGIAVAGMLLLVSFRQAYAVTISVSNAILVWPVLWIAQQSAELSIGMFDLTGEGVLIAFLLCIGTLTTVLPPVIEYVVRSAARQRFDSDKLEGV